MATRSSLTYPPPSTKGLANCESSFYNEAMQVIPVKLREELAEDPYYQRCVRHSKDCRGRITWEHAFIYAGKQIQEKWAIIPLCEYHHSVCRFQDAGNLNKEINHYIALSRATPEDLAKYPKKDWEQLKKYLHGKYHDKAERK